MKRPLRLLAGSIAILLLTPVLAIAAYWAAVFLPRLDDIEAVLAAADPLDRHPPRRIRDYLVVAHADGPSIAHSASRQLTPRLLPRTSNLKRIGREIAWSGFLSLHFSNVELMGLYSSLAYNGEGQGLNALSLRLFAKPLDALSNEEAATVVAYTWAPQVYGRSRHLLEQRRDKLMAATAGLATPPSR